MQTSTVVLVEVAAPEDVSMYALFVSIAEIEVPVTQLNSDAVFTRFVHPFTVQYQEVRNRGFARPCCRRQWVRATGSASTMPPSRAHACRSTAAAAAGSRVPTF